MGEGDADCKRPLPHLFLDDYILFRRDGAREAGNYMEADEISEDMAVKDGNPVTKPDIPEEMARLLVSQSFDVQNEPLAQFRRGTVLSGRR